MHSKKRAGIAYLFILPFFLVYVVFKLYPILYSMYISLCNYEPFKPIKFIGLENYKVLFTTPNFYESILNTLIIWTMSIIPQLSLALVLALLLNVRWLKGRSIYRSLFYFPNLVTPVTIGVLFGILFSYPSGAVNLLLQEIGILQSPIDFQSSPFWARLVVGIAICWQNFGYNIIFFTAGLNSISADVYEAAEVDGANAWESTVHITLPLLKPMLVYVLVTSVIGGLQIFDVSKLVFKDVPGDATTTMVQYMYDRAFENWRLGYGAAASYGIFLIIAVFSLLSFFVTSGKKDKEAT